MRAALVGLLLAATPVAAEVTTHLHALPVHALVNQPCDGTSVVHQIPLPDESPDGSAWIKFRGFKMNVVKTTLGPTTAYVSIYADIDAGKPEREPVEYWAGSGAIAFTHNGLTTTFLRAVPGSDLQVLYFCTGGGSYSVYLWPYYEATH